MAFRPTVNFGEFIGTLARHLKPIDEINGFKVRPGFFDERGAMVIPGGVNFTIHSQDATSVKLALFRPQAADPYAVLPFPEHYRVGDVYSMIVFGLDIEEFEYAYIVDGPYEPAKGLIYDKTRYLLDPYARAVAGQRKWGSRPEDGAQYRARVVASAFDWAKIRQPDIPMEDLIIYELHVRGFTMHPSSGVKKPGTFAGLMEKIPYLLELGVNAVELMPIFEFDELRDERLVDGNPVLDYWGYNPIGFFAPNTSYVSALEHNREGTELKKLIQKLHENGIEVILDVVFNHTAEGDEKGPFISFKGFDNRVYYMLTPDGHYYNFSGCGNTLNCNHPIVQEMILSCLRYWSIEYRVDGFRFDLASILGRNEDGTPSSNPPLLENLAFDPVLARVKLIAEAWDAGGLYQVGSFPSWKRWSEWNGKYRDDMRCFLKGDPGLAHVAAERIAGSQDIYNPDRRGMNASVNFITCHDGFTLNDLYSYNVKHNEANGWDNTDGEDHNNSWNCGVEGETGDEAVLRLRKKMIQNALAVLLVSHGTPMLRAGDEFGNSQAGNNNAYCQDNAISWLDWELISTNRDLFEFCKKMIAFRKDHPVVRGSVRPAVCGWPAVSKHGVQPWYLDDWVETRVLGVMYAGRNQDDSADEIVYLAVNAYWGEQTLRLPDLPDGLEWRVAVQTGGPDGEDAFAPTSGRPLTGSTIDLPPRSVSILFAVSLNAARPTSGG